jgi:TRAP-type C4-dicarboxylate transport system permease large subunit
MPTLGNKTVSMGRTMFGLFGFFAGFAGLCYGLQYPVRFVTSLFPDMSGPVLALGLFGIYVLLVRIAANQPDLQPDDPFAPVVELPDVSKVVKTGLHYVLPIFILVYFLMIERKSPGLSAFWASMSLVLILLTQQPLKAMFRNQGAYRDAIWAGIIDLRDGLIDGARNMIGIALATATAGIIVGTVSLTGVGQVMADFVEYLSGGHLMLMLLCVAVLSLVLGMGLPTTANYIVVSSLMVPVIVELGGDSGLVVSLVAAHFFVFYFGIMADVTPPVGLASFAAAAVSGGDAVRTGVTAFFYSLRTVVLPFVFIFNTDLLLIDVTWAQGLAVFISSTIGILIFTAATMGWFLVRNRWWETIAMLAVALAIFRPGLFLDQIQPPFMNVNPATFEQQLDTLAPDTTVRLEITGPNFNSGAMDASFMTIDVPDGADRLTQLGLTLSGPTTLDEPAFGSKIGASLSDFDFYGDEPVRITSLEIATQQIAKEIIWLPAMLLLLLIIVMQRRRAHSTGETK